MDNDLYDITKVCKMLNTTSRTLRFYEEKGIIQSSFREDSSRRHYSEDQIANIRNVLVLRTLGLSLDEIVSLKKNSTELKTAVLSKRAEIYSLIDKCNKKINFLNEAIAVIESGKDIFTENLMHTADITEKEKYIVGVCSEAIVNGNTDVIYNYLSDKIKRYMPRDSYECMRADVMAPLGEFVGFDRVDVDNQSPNKYYQFIKYSNVGFKITYTFHDEKLSALWLAYYDMS